MKKGIHPEYNEINVTLTDGKVVKMYSTSKKDIVLDTDPSNHPAWTGVRASQEKGKKIDEFNKKFSGFKF